VSPFRGFTAVAYKEFLHVLRDPATRFVFIIPVFQLILFGYAIHLEVEHLPAIVVDADRTEESRTLLDAYRHARTFDVRAQASDVETMQREIVAGHQKVGILIPEGFARKLHRGEAADVLVLIDGSNSTVASAALSTTAAIARTQSARIRAVTWDTHDLARMPQSVPLATVQNKARLLFNPNLRSANFFVPGLVGVILQLIAVLLTAFSIVREREAGTLEQLMVTPIGAWGLLLGKLVPYAVIAVIETALVLNLMVHAFGVPVAGSMPLLAVLSFLFLLTSLSLGVIISTKAQNQAEAMQLTFLILLPSILLSGFVFPLESIPRIIYPLTFLIPVRYFIEILRGIILRDAPFGALWEQTAALALYTAVLLGIGALRFRRRLM
jgi:ABC-type multidrug transport system permease subunit